MENPIVHIGYHKTATNWFQRAFYPEIKNYFYVSRKKVRRTFLFPHALCFDSRASRHYLEGLSSLPLILCEEELSGNLHTGGHCGCIAKDVANRIKTSLPNAKIVIFIRSQVDMIASVYKQYIKEGGTHSPRRYLFPHNYLSSSGFSPYHIPLFSFDHFRYYPLIQYYQRLFGRERVHVYPYEAFRADNAGFISRMGAEFNFEISASAIDFAPQNLTYKSATLRIARLINRLTYQDVMDKTYLVHIPHLYKNTRKLLKHINKWSIMGKSPSPEKLMGRGIVAHIKTYYGENNFRMGRELNLPLEKYGYF